MARLKWIVVRTAPVHGSEFKVEHQAGELDPPLPAMLPWENAYVRRPGSKVVRRKYAIFPRYVFVGTEDVIRDYVRLRDRTPEVQGVLNLQRNVWSPYVLAAYDVTFIAALVDRNTSQSTVDFHRALKPGKAVEIEVGDGIYKAAKIDKITKRGIATLLEMFGSMHQVEVPFNKVRAA